MINNSVKKCCVCNNEKIGEFITINDKKYHLCCIEQLKKQKDDVVELINYYGITPEQNDNTILRHILKDLLRMLGEIDV